ncbi:hypothetical protein TorRG33x02_053300 [Trema orientale]|uniref:Uncharacterized protein n=1 Tax=Trema orientale TaxID=63057 RepID=A0A2P5FMX2_TREOI|nr:hypothetical protein TorRG33x02_053300 [Trema orientale]
MSDTLGYSLPRLKVTKKSLLVFSFHVARITINPQHLSSLSLAGEESFKLTSTFGFSVLDLQHALRTSVAAYVNCQAQAPAEDHVARRPGWLRPTRTTRDPVLPQPRDSLAPRRRAQEDLYQPLLLRRDLLRLPNARGLSPSYYLQHFPTVGPMVRGFNCHYIRRVKSHKG